MVAYRSSAHIAACLAPLLADPSVTEIVVMDNSSEQSCGDILRALASESSSTRVSYFAGTNVGYAKACNRGVSLLKDVDQVLILNPDVTLTRPLRELAELAADDSFSIVTATLGSKSGVPTNVRRAVTLRRELVKAIAGSRTYLYSPEKLPRAAGLILPDQADGAMLLMRKDLFSDLSGFDERFELYYEDVDICQRARGLAPLACHPEPWGSHIGGASFRQSVSGAAFEALRISRIRYLRKHATLKFGLKAALIALAMAEVAVRSLARSPEGDTIRARALVTQISEIRRPASMWILSQQ